MTASPERTCIGCRTVGPACRMVRLVAPDGRVQVAQRAKLAGKVGRGAWVHHECLIEAIKRGAMARAFRRQVEVGDGLALSAQAHCVPGRSITAGKSR